MSQTPPSNAVAVDLKQLLRIDIDAELRKLTVAQLQGPWQLPAELVRRAIREGAGGVRVELARGACTVRDDGPPLAHERLAELAVMLDAAAPSERRHRALLALEAAGGLALLALAGIGATHIEVVARGGGKLRRLTWTARASRAELVEAADPGGARGSEISVRSPDLDAARARAWLRDVARFAPGDVSEGGQPINTGLQGYLASERFSLGPRSEPARLTGHLAVARHGEHARVWLLHGGVVATHLGMSSVPCFDAIVEVSALVGLSATAADLRAAMNPYLGPIADLGVGLLMQVARKLPEIDSVSTQTRVLVLLLQAVRTRRRLAELMHVRMLPCWTPIDPQTPRTRPACWLSLAELPQAERNQPPVVLALYPEQDPEDFALPEAPVLRLDAAERSALTELFGLRFRAPPPRAEVGGRLRNTIRRGLRGAGQAIARLLHLGPGAPLPESSLGDDERDLLVGLRAILRGGPGAPETIHLCAGRAAPQIVGGTRGQLLVGREHPDLRACLAAARRGPAWLYPASVTLLGGHALPATAARVTWLRHWQDPQPPR
jgi:hypothetical protein